MTVSVEDSGSSSLGTSINVSLPGSYTADDYFVLIASRNNAGTLTFESNVTATSIQDLSARLSAYRIEPDTLSETDFDVSGSNSFWSWALVKVTDADTSATVVSAGSNIGNNSTSNIEVSPLTDLGFIATGDETVLSVGSTNATASFTTSGDTIYNTTSGNAALMVNSTNPSAGDITVFPADIDRGNDTVTRYESTLTLILSTTPSGENNLLTNPSFELGATIATDWVDESSVIGTPTYSLATSNLEDGEKSQRVQYTGVSGDSTGKVQFYQAPISSGFSIGDTVQFDIYISGSLTNAYGIIGVEAFESDTSYISDVSTPFTSLDGTPTKYTIQYKVPPLSDYLAVFIQFPSFGETGDVDVYFDKATLKTVQPTSNLGFFAIAGR